MIDFPITGLLDDSICTIWLERHLHPDGLSRKQLHTLRQRIQTRLNATAPIEVMVGTAFEADELYQNAGKKKHAPSRSH